MRPPLTKEEAEAVVRTLERMERVLRKFQDKMRERNLPRTDRYSEEIQKAWTRIWALKMETRCIADGRPRSKTVVQMATHPRTLRLVNEGES